MENTDSNSKPAQTGGLKLMTVFIAVLALHAVVIGGFAIYHLMSGGASDADLSVDKAHKNVKVTADGTSDSTPAPEPSTTDKSLGVATPAPDATVTPATSPAPVENTAANESAAPTTTITPPNASVPSGPVVNPPVATAPSSAPAASPESSLLTDTATPAADGQNGAPYVVRSGDSLARIAHQHHTSVAKLKAANSLTSDMLHIGQKLVVPMKTQIASAATSPRIHPAMTKMGTGPIVKNATASSHHLYTVVKGDTLTKIAHKFKTTPTALMTANNLTDAGKLTIGKKLKIPSAEARSATNAEPATEPSAVQAKSNTTAQLANFVQ